MRVLHVSDTHLGIDRWFMGAPPGWRRGVDHLAAMRRVLAPAFAGAVDLVLHTGDLFDRSRPPPAAVAAAGALLAEVGRVVPTVVMPGNHDRRGLRGHFPAPPPGVLVVDEPTPLRVAGLRVAVVPFFRDADTWAAAAARAVAGGADLLLAHQAFDGSRVPGFRFREGHAADVIAERHLPRGVTTILNGHIHTRQVLRLGGAEVVHVGSTERTSFVERDEPKGALLWSPGAAPAWLDAAPRPMVVVRSEADLGAVEDGALVALGREARTEAMDAAARARGGWVSPWARPTGQLSLFGQPA